MTSDYSKVLESFMIPATEGENIENTKTRFNAYWKTYRATQKDAKAAAKSGDYKTAAAKCRAGAKELRALASVMKNAPADANSAMISHIVHAALYVLKVQIGFRILGTILAPGLKKLLNNAVSEVEGDAVNLFAKYGNNMDFSMDGYDYDDDYDIGTEGAATAGLLASVGLIGIGSFAALISEIVVVIGDVVKAYKAYRTVSRSNTSEAAKQANVIRNKSVAAITKSAELLEKRAKKYDEEAAKKKDN